ncbi:MAG: dihydrodipicolinate synthase family protein [Thermotogaceae bacterium]|nr:dihydrodipicolinate synthase family protein [Thermotogaceae bacterium]
MGKLKKLVVPNLTKFDEEGNLVLDEAYKNFLEKLVENGVDVLMPCGSNSEFHVMDIEERKAMVEFVMDVMKNKAEIMPHVGSASYKETKTLANHAFSLGVKRVSIVVPYYFVYDEKALIDYFVSLAREFSDKEFVLYNIPAFAGNTLEIDTILKIKEKAPNVVGLKDTASRPWIVNIIKREVPGFIIYGGNDSMIIDYVGRGADGHVSGSANVFPKLVRKLLDEVEAGNYKQAFLLQIEMEKIIRNITGREAFIAANKYTLKIAGFDLGVPGKPSRPLSEDEMNEIDKFLPEVKDWVIS